MKRSPSFAGALLALGLLLVASSTAQVATDVFVVERILVSSTRVTRDLTDFTYRIRVVNQGGALAGATAFVSSLSPNTVIRDNEVRLGDLPAGSTVTSTDTFTLRQNRLVPFQPADLVWTIEAQPANTRPVARAGADQTVPTGTLVTLDGTGSSDADGDPLQHRWTVLSRPNGSNAALSNTSVPRPTFSVDRGGDYRFQLVVNDGRTDSTPDEVLVSTINSAPVAEAGPDQTVARGSLVTLDGSSSSDPDFDALAFDWSVVNAPAGSTAALQDTMTARPRLQLDKAGSYRMRLVVSDGILASSPDFVTVSTVNSAPVADAGPNQDGTLGVPVTLDGSASSDADGDPLSLLWSWNSRPGGSTAALDLTNPLRPVFTPDTYGDYVAQLIVNDGWTDSAPATVTVGVPRPQNRAPRAVDDVAATGPGIPVVIDVLGNDSDPDGDTITLQSFTQPAGGPATGTVTQEPGGLRFTPQPGFSGEASFGYTISDGKIEASATVTVTVSGGTNRAPQVDAGPDAAAVVPYPRGVASLQLAGSATDDGQPAGAPLTLTWTRESGPGPAIIATPTAATTAIEVGAPGSYVFRLTASDGELSGSDTVVVVLDDLPNSAPVLAPIADRTLAVGDALSLQLAASDSDPFDTITFSLGDAPAGASLSTSGRLDWTAASAGTFTFTVTARDAAGLSASTTFSVTAVAGNRPPVWGPLDDESTSVGAAYAKPVSATDPDGDAVAIEILSAPGGLTLVGSELRWRPTSDQVGRSMVKLLARDARGATTAALFRIDVAFGATIVANDDGYSVRVGETLDVPAPGVLENDSSSPVGALQALRRSDPALGTLTAFGADGAFTYQAPAAFTPPSVNPDVLWRAAYGTSSYSQLVDVNRDGTPDVLYSEFGAVRAVDGRNGGRLWNFNPARSPGVDFTGCSTTPYNTVAAGDIDDSGDISVITSATCSYATYAGLVAINASQITAGEVGAKWVTREVRVPHPDAYSGPTATAPAVPALLPNFSPMFATEPTLARFAPGEGVKILTRTMVGSYQGSYWGRGPNGQVQTLYAGCRTLTGLASDEGVNCRATYVFDGRTGAVDAVLTAPNLSGEVETTRRPWRQNPPIVADLDGDQVVEIISGSDVFHRVGGQWTLWWQSRCEPESVAVADLDGDGQAEVIQWQNGAYCPTEKGLRIHRADGTLLRSIPLPQDPGYNIHGALTIADIDADKAPEIVFQQRGYLYAYRGDGRLLWMFATPDTIVPALSGPVPPPQGQDDRTSTTPPMVYDLDLDGIPEVITQATRRLSILDGRSGRELWWADTEQSGFDNHTVALADFDLDGHVDIFTQGSNRWNCSFGPGTGPVTCRGSSLVFRGMPNWAPGPAIFNQIQFRPGAVSDTGTILYDGSTRRDFRVPVQRGTPVDPRARRGTSFLYAATDGSVESAPATVNIEIRPVNSPPVITSLPPTGLASVPPYTRPIYQITATDPDPGDTIRYELVATNHAFAAYGGVTVDAATGQVSFYTGPCGSYGGACTLSQVHVVVAAVDSQGARTEQSFLIDIGPGAAAVPDIAAQSLGAALDALSAAGLRGRVIEERYDPAPAGTVLSQFPLAGGNGLAIGASVDLIVSRGPAPQIVPNVVTLIQSQANTRLAAAGFSTGTVTREFSTTIPRGEVISQTPAAGIEIAPTAVALVVSAGPGIALRLASAVTTADRPIPFAAVHVDLDGVETPATGLTYAFAADLATAGPAPVVTSGNIVPAPATLGGYTLTIRDAQGREASASFTVMPPVIAGEAEPMAMAFLRLSVAMDDINTLAIAARKALADGDVNQQRALLRAMVERWRQVDLQDLRLSVPLAPESGFAPLVEQMAGFGVTPGTDDLLVERVLKDANADLAAWIAGLRATGTSMTELDALADQFGSRAARLDGLAVTEWGMVNAADEYTLLLARRIPELYEAIMDEVAVVVGLPATRVAALVDDPAADAARLQLARERFGTRPAAATTGDSDGGVQVSSTLAELAVTQATQWVVDKVIEDFNKKYKNAKKFASDIMTQAFGGALIVASVSHIRQWVQGEDIGEVVSGASLSLRVFEAPYSFIEGPFDVENPELNQVFIIGPTLIDQVRPFIEKFKDAMKYRQQLNPQAKDGKYKSASEIKKDLRSFYDALKALQQGANQIIEDIANIEQLPTGADRPCVFDSYPACGQLLFDVGFRSVYKYSPPPGFDSFTGLPLPIVFVVYNYRNNTMYFATPPFFPTPADPPAAP